MIKECSIIPDGSQDLLKRIETYATELRCMLEELSEDYDDISLCDGNGCIYNNYDIQDMADMVSNIENLFDEDEEL